LRPRQTLQREKLREKKEKGKEERGRGRNRKDDQSEQWNMFCRNLGSHGPRSEGQRDLAKELRWESREASNRRGIVVLRREVCEGGKGRGGKEGRI